MMAHKRIVTLGWGLAFVTMLLDQLSKWVMLEKVQIHMRPPIEVTSFFNLVMVWNHGISFGMFSEHRLPYALIAVALVVITVLAFWLRKADDKLTAIGIGLVIGGAFGNIIDRVRFGAVADFLDFHAFGYHWPAFNLADSTIFIGVVVLCIQSIMHPQK